MSLKNVDRKNRWRNKVVAFRVSSEEDAQIEAEVKLSGLTKQDYIIRRLLAVMWSCRAIPESTKPCVISLQLCWMNCGELKLETGWTMNFWILSK